MMSEPRPPLPDSYEGLRDRSLAALQAGDVESALALHQRLVEKLGRLSDGVLARRPGLRDMELQARLELAEMLRLEGRLPEAIEVKEVLLNTHPDRAADWRRDLAVLRVAKGEVETGLAELRALAGEDPEDTWRWIVLGVELRLEGRLAESQEALDQALVSAKDGGDSDELATAHYHRFLLCREMGRLDDALAAWNDALDQNADVGSTVREVYTMLTDAGRYSEARHFADRDDNELQAGYQRGLLAQLAGSAAEAKREWREVSRLDPEEFDYGQDAWAEAVLRLGDPEPVLERMGSLLRRHSSARLLTLTGVACAMRGDRQKAQQAFQRTIDMLRSSRPPKHKLDSADWRLLDSLVTDEELKTLLKPYFAVVETVWG
jgi:tetratricopeptide (TPR) repeat protein